MNTVRRMSWQRALASVAALMIGTGFPLDGRAGADPEFPASEEEEWVPADLDIPEDARPTPDLDRGAELYRTRCASCHGPDL